MGTRSITRIIPRQKGVSFSDMESHRDKAIIEMYRQYDSVPVRYGVELAKFLVDIRIVDGLNDRDTNLANGAGCLAAQVVAEFKEVPGNIYLQQPDFDDDHYCDYTYTIFPKVGEETMIAIHDGDDDCIFVGNANALIDYYTEPEECECCGRNY
jgi:hypothetical protein